MKKISFLILTLLATSLYSSNPSQAAIFIKPVEKNTKSIEPDVATINLATVAFNDLSRKEKKERIKEIKKEIRKYKAEKKAGMEPSTNTLLLVILSFLLPPLAVYLHQGEANNKFWLSVVLTLLFWVPGVIYSLIVVLGADK